jgi:predicted CoA-substrate-specific enzyme activase
MRTAGIDMGAQSTKVVILEDARILAAVTLKTAESADREALQAMEEALRRAGLTRDDVEAIVATGAGRTSVAFARKQRSIVSCLASAAHFLYPQARTVIDGGAESSTAIRMSADGTVENSVTNDRCAAGAGVFLDTMSAMLRIPLGELGPVSLKATRAVAIGSKCAVFAESEVISLVHEDPPVPVANILAGIHESMADRLFGMAQRVGMQPEVVMSGGVSRNVGIVRAMEARMGRPVLVAEDPQVMGAFGAALIAWQGSARGASA